jgi:type II secretory pathway component GspD/PulD (secretin)
MLTLALCAPGAVAQAQSADSTPANAKSAESKPPAETYQTLYLTNLTQEGDAQEVQTDLRNMLPRARVFYLPSQNAISVRATPDDMLLAQKVLSDLDRTKKIYRLTYTINETDGGKNMGTQRFALIVVSGQKTVLKQGRRVPIVTGTTNTETAAQNTQIQYEDVGLSIEATLDGYQDGVRLRTKVEQSSVADERSNVGLQDPVIRQTSLEGTSTLVQGKPLVLGSLDMPGSTRHQDIEVVSEIVR